MTDWWHKIFNIADDNNKAKKSWSELFKIGDTETIPQQVESVVESTEWILCGTCALTATALFIVSANRIRQGDSLGACLSGIGALIIALAPHIASFFEIKL